MERSFRALNPGLKAVVLGVPVIGILLAVLAARGGVDAAESWRWLLVPVCFAATVIAERYPVKIAPQQKINLGTLPCLLAAVLLPPAIGPTVAALGVLTGNLVVRRTWWEAWFNAGNVLVAASLAAIIGSVTVKGDGAEDARAALAAVVYVGVNLALGVWAPAVHTGRPYPALLRQAAAASWTASLTLAASAVSVAILSVEAPIVAALPLIVLPLIYRMNVAINAQAKANEQLAGVLAAQRRFLTDVSHQVATPLATIMTNLSILSRRQKDNEAIQDSVAEAERMRRMLARLRSLAQADEDVPLRKELVDLAELTADVVRTFAAQAGTTGVGLVTEVSERSMISADKDLLREAVANLVDNAVRVSPPGTEVTLRVARSAAGSSIDVIDRGPGIDDDRLRNLFDRFQRSDSGSGLGLAIARRVVERHGGTIRVDTEVGSGTKFTIQLPA